MSATAIPEPMLAEEPPVSVWRLRWRRLKRDRTAMAGAMVLILLFAACASAAVVESWLNVSGVEINLLGRFAPASLRHLAGDG